MKMKKAEFLVYHLLPGSQELRSPLVAPQYQGFEEGKG
jgi:hypothetical protein